MRPRPPENTSAVSRPRGASRPASDVPLRLFVCLLCALAGFFLGRLGPSRPAADTPSAPEAPRRDPTNSPSLAKAASLPAATADTAVDDASDPAAARRRKLISLLQSVHKSRRNENLGELFSLVSWTQSADQEELEECLALSDEMATSNERHGANDMVQTLVFVRWAALDGPAALEAWLALPKEKQSSEARAQLFLSWSEHTDPQDALDHLFASTPEDETAATAAQILSRWQLRDPAGATACAARLASSSNLAERNTGAQCASTLLDRVRQDGGVPSALDWIDRWPAAGRDELRLRLLNNLNVNAPDSPASAASILAKLAGPAPNLAGRTINNLAQQFAARAPAEAQRWALSLPEPARTEATAAVARTVVDGMLGKGRGTEASAWLENQSIPAAARTSGYEQMADAAARNGDLGEALRLAGRAAGDSPRLSPEKHGQLLQQWLENHPERAVKVINLLTTSSNPAAPAAP